MKHIKILKVDALLTDHFGVKVGDRHKVISERQGEVKYGYLIYLPNGKAIVIYRDECEVIIE